MTPESFTRQVIEVLAKRAANTCSNPDCSAVTSGPSSDYTKALNVGEAAHIYGARPGSARFDATLGEIARADITNGIWLCRICHKVIDSDPQKYPAELLFEWRRMHEERVAESLGRAGSLLRKKVQDQKLEHFMNCSYLAQQIIIDKPEAWEYKLTAEFLKSELEPVQFRWQSLQSEFYALPVKQVPIECCFEWLRENIENVRRQIAALSGLLNSAFRKAWGEPGQPGSEIEIYRVCMLVAEAAQRLLDWEERVRFASLPEEFESMQPTLINTAGKQIDKILEIPKWLDTILASPELSGTYRLELIFELPETWVKELTGAMDVAARKMRRR